MSLELLSIPLYFYDSDSIEKGKNMQILLWTTNTCPDVLTVTAWTKQFTEASDFSEDILVLNDNNTTEQWC